MTAPFAARQARVDAAIMRHLANVEVTVGDVQLPAIFDRGHIESLGAYAGGIDAEVPMCLVLSTDVTGQAIGVGSELRLPGHGETWWGNQSWWGGTVFTVRSVRHDGAGMTALILEVTA